MKILILVTGLLASLNLYATNLGWVALTKQTLKEHAEECKAAGIVVEQIVKNSHIQGHVTGLKETSLEDFKMIFYVKSNSRSNMWYVHPYQYNQNQTTGYSWSDLTTGGNFWIRSVFRIASKEMAVLLVPGSHQIYNTKSDLKSLTKYACKYITIPGNGDFAP